MNTTENIIIVTDKQLDLIHDIRAWLIENEGSHSFNQFILDKISIEAKTEFFLLSSIIKNLNLIINLKGYKENDKLFLNVLRKLYIKHKLLKNEKKKK